MLDYKKAFNDRPALNEAFRRPVEEKKQRRETQIVRSKRTNEKTCIFSSAVV